MPVFTFKDRKHVITFHDAAAVNSEQIYAIAIKLFCGTHFFEE
jgi:hypothetical protein